MSKRPIPTSTFYRTEPSPVLIVRLHLKFSAAFCAGYFRMPCQHRRSCLMHPVLTLFLRQRRGAQRGGATTRFGSFFFRGDFGRVAMFFPTSIVFVAPGAGGFWSFAF